MRFDDYEINRVAEYKDGPDDPGFCEVIDEDADENELRSKQTEIVRTFWSVYGHLPEGGVECIADRETKEDAEELVARLPLVPKRHQGQKDICIAALWDFSDFGGLHGLRFIGPFADFMEASAAILAAGYGPGTDHPHEWSIQKLEHERGVL